MDRFRHQIRKKDILSDDNFKRKMQEDDGFEWYIAYKGDLCGAENKEEKFIIPIKYDGISYESKILVIHILKSRKR